MQPQEGNNLVPIGLDTAKPLFVASDLHLGNGHCAFARMGKELSFNRFLDYVEREGGQLLILGDLLELWRYTLDAVVHRWRDLLDRLYQIQAFYVPGNHDEAVMLPASMPYHPLFTRAVGPFYGVMGAKCIQFMHGHEIDPFDRHAFHRNDLYMRCYHAFYDARARTQWLAHEGLADVGLGLSECLLRFWHWLTRVSGVALHPELAPGPAVPVRLRDLRTQKMLSRFCYHRDETCYDVAVVGHTHRVGRYDAWYFNSGCWVKPNDSFLKLHADGHVEVFDWIQRQARPNEKVLFGA